MRNVFIGVIALGLMTFLAFRTVVRGPLSGTEHSLGSTAAPVVVEEWSDFE